MDPITETFWFAIIATAALALFYWLSDIDQAGRSNWSKIVSRYTITSSPAARQQPEESFDDDFDDFDEEDEDGVDGVAEPDNEGKEALHIAERAKVEAIAQLVVESKRKSFQNGAVPEVRAITTVFGVTVSSKEGSEYQRLRAMLKEQLAKLELQAVAPRYSLTEEQQAARQELGLEMEV